MHGTIRNEGHLTLAGKYYDSEWEGFLEAARNFGPKGQMTTKSKRKLGKCNKSVWRSFKRYVINENFFRFDRKKRLSLSVCHCFVYIGIFSFNNSEPRYFY